jgi:hypothetical protein
MVAGVSMTTPLLRVKLAHILMNLIRTWMLLVGKLFPKSSMVAKNEARRSEVIQFFKAVP